MSAINPASFASPTLGIQAPSGIGPGAVGAGRAPGSGERRQQSHQAQEQSSQAFGQAPQVARGFRPAFSQPFGGDRQVPPASAYPAANYAFGGGGAFGNARTNPAYAPSLSPGLEASPARASNSRQTSNRCASGSPVDRQFPVPHPTVTAPRPSLIKPIGPRHSRACP